MDWRAAMGGAIALLVTLNACGGDADEAPAGVPICEAGLEACGAACVDTDADPRHCGACGEACAAGSICVEGSCEIRCPEGQVVCSGGCFALDESAAHCGACGVTCGPDAVCAGGSCVQACPAGQQVCDGGCFDTEASPRHCGGCGNACNGGEACLDGACVTSCAAGLVACGGACTDPATDRSNCGGCGVRCGADELCTEEGCSLACPRGLSSCDGACRDTDADRNHCGSCGNACATGELCADGTCVPSCTDFASDLCDGACTNLNVDAANCGSCGNACAAGEFCQAGACAPACGVNDDACGGNCTSIEHDPANCGACGTACRVRPNAVPVCVAGGCTSRCLDGWADCDGQEANGCEVFLATDLGSCGSCGNACPIPENASAGCAGGVCGVGLCAAGRADCDSDPSNGCEANLVSDETTCSSCGNACAAGDYCINSTCLPPQPGESCASPITLYPGTHTITWTATEQDHVVTAPACGIGANPTGPDLVLTFVPSGTGFAQVRIDKPATARWHVLVVEGSCSGVATPLRCASEPGSTSVDLLFPVTGAVPYFIHLVDSEEGAEPLDNPLAVEVIEHPDVTAGAGESCGTAVPIVAGTNTVTWAGALNNYMTGSIPCSTTPATGPDVVMHYAATFDGAIDVAVDKASGPRWHFVATEGVCGDIDAAVACMSGTAATLGSTIDVVAGHDYYLHAIDSTSGADPLGNPLTVRITERNCSIIAPQATTLSPANGTTVTTILPKPSVTFDQPVDQRHGTITLTGSLGTTRSFVLPSPAITFSGDRRTLSLAAAGFLSGETITVGWSGLVDATCGRPIPSPTWSFTLPVTPCTPGQGGLLAGTMTRMPFGAVGTLGENFVAVDADPTGWIYLGGSSVLYRTSKDGTAFQDVRAAAGLVDANLGYTMAIDGPNLYTVESKTSGTDGHLWRISSDGGANWVVENAANFPSVPGDDFASAAVQGGQIHLLTAEATAATGNEIWSVDPSSGLPATAVLEATFGVGTHVQCHGLAVDAHAWFSICREQVSGSPWHIVRIDRATKVLTELASTFPGNISSMALHGKDHDGDGRFDFLYAHSQSQSGYFVCDPWGTPYFDELFTFGPDTTLNYGMGFDPASNKLWAFDDDSFEFIEIQ